MRTARLRDLEVGRIGFGSMPASFLYSGAGKDEPEALRAIARAVDAGVTLIDTAEIYGPYANEELLGRGLAGRRDQVVLATKFGMISHRMGASGIGTTDSTPANIAVAVDGSLARLGTDRIDLLYQHRVDPHVPIEEVVGAMAELVTAGKVLDLGLSEASVDTVTRANRVHPITAVQSEYSLWTRDVEADLLPALRELGIGFVAYSPLGRGFLTGAIRSLDDLGRRDYRRTNPRFVDGALEQNLRLVEEIESVAGGAGATPAQVALAWLLAKGDDIVPIPGTKRAARVLENAEADQVELTPDQIAQLDRLTPAVGARYNDEELGTVGL